MAAASSVLSQEDVASWDSLLAAADGDLSNQLASGDLAAVVSGTWDGLTAQDVYGDGYAATKLPTNNNVAFSEAVAENIVIAALAKQSEYSQAQHVGNNYWDPTAT